jgi:hypothetical protein
VGPLAAAARPAEAEVLERPAEGLVGNLCERDPDPAANLLGGELEVAAEGDDLLKGGDGAVICGLSVCGNCGV